MGYVFSNLELEGAKLRFSLKKPFNMFVDLASDQDWLKVFDTIRTEHYKDVVLITPRMPEFLRQAA